MYKYRHILKLANDKLSNETNLSIHKNTIAKAVEHYNAVSSQAKNKKKIIDFKVSEKEIELISISDEALGKPNVALQVFSRYISKNGFEDFVRNKLLFKGTAERILEDDNALSEDELLLEIIKIFRKGDKVAQDKIEQFRKIVIE